MNISNLVDLKYYVLAVETLDCGMISDERTMAKKVFGMNELRQERKDLD